MDGGAPESVTGCESGKKRDGGMNRRNVYTLVISMFFISSAYTMLIPFLPLYLIELGVTGTDVNFWTGMVFSVCFLVAGIMGPVWGKLADTKGKKKMVIRAAVLIGISYCMAGVVQNEWQLFGVRAFQGFANGFVAASLAIISQSVPARNLGMALGFAQTSLILGGIGGPLLGGFISHLFGMRASFFIGAAVLWLAALAVWHFVEEKEIPGNRADGSVMDDLRYAYGNVHVRELLVFFFIFQSAILMIQPIVPLYIGELSGSMDGAAVTSGVVLSCGGIAGALTTALWGRFGQKYGYFVSMALTFTMAGLFLMVQGLPRTVLGFGICQFLVGCFLIGTNPAINAAFVRYTPEDFRGRVFGLANTAQQFGNMTGPLAASWLTVFWPMPYVFFLAGAIQLGTGLYIARRHVLRGERG